MSIETFATIEPTPENYFRSVVLFGRNVASYKFAMAKSLLVLASDEREVVSLEELAAPFAREVCAHLRDAPKQATSKSSKFLDACRSFNDDSIDSEQLVQLTARLGFQNVIDAFHNVGSGEIPIRFYLDQRRSNVPSIAITDEMRHLAMSVGDVAMNETDARWRLVETAWELGTTPSIIQFDTDSGQLIAPTRRKSVTSARAALNGYQKGRCFYCYRRIGIRPGDAELADVDHVFPHVLQRFGIMTNLDGVWNLVLACATCNRGPRGKFDSTPATTYIERLHRRNEYLILSHHPLRQTLIAQTGDSMTTRRAFLQASLDEARRYQVATWTTPMQGDPAF